MTSPFQTAVSAVRERKPYTSQREAEEIVRVVLEAVRQEGAEQVDALVELCRRLPADYGNYNAGLAGYRAMIDALLGSGG